MSEMMRCPKCGKETNKYAPCCEHCAAILERPSGQDNADRPAAPAGKGELTKFYKKCPFCAEKIQIQAVKCRFCGETVTSGDKNKLKTFFIAMAVIVTLLVIFAGTFFVVTKIWHPKAANMRLENRIKELSSELKADPAKAEYVKNFVTLSDIGTLDDIEAATSKPVKCFYGTIRNNGSKLIIRLQLMVYYFDKSGACIAENSVLAIQGTKGKVDSVKAMSSRDFQVPMTVSIPGWTGKIRAKISNIEFAD